MGFPVTDSLPLGVGRVASAQAMPGLAFYPCLRGARVHHDLCPAQAVGSPRRCEGSTAAWGPGLAGERRPWVVGVDGSGWTLSADAAQESQGKEMRWTCPWPEEAGTDSAQGAGPGGEALRLQSRLQRRAWPPSPQADPTSSRARSQGPRCRETQGGQRDRRLGPRSRPPAHLPCDPPQGHVNSHRGSGQAYLFKDTKVMPIFPLEKGEIKGPTHGWHLFLTFLHGRSRMKDPGFLGKSNLVCSHTVHGPGIAR